MSLISYGRGVATPAGAAYAVFQRPPARAKRLMYLVSLVYCTVPVDTDSAYLGIYVACTQSVATCRHSLVFWCTVQYCGCYQRPYTTVLPLHYRVLSASIHFVPSSASCLQYRTTHNLLAAVYVRCVQTVTHTHTHSCMIRLLFRSHKSVAPWYISDQTTQNNIQITYVLKVN